MNFFKSNKLLLLIFGLIFLLSSFCLTACKNQGYGISDRHIVRILFVGNSYTFFNDMPLILEKLANEDAKSQLRIETRTLAKGGATLAYMLSLPEVQTILNEKKWDYIVFQPQSLWAATQSRILSTDRALNNWCKAARSIDAKPILFQTWARRPNHDLYASREFKSFPNYEQMHSRISYNSEALAKKYNMLLAPVGNHWNKIHQEDPNLKIYNSDGSHPSKLGSFMTAWVFYKMLVDQRLLDIKY